MRTIWNLESILGPVAVPHFDTRPDGRLVATGPLTRDALLEAATVVAGGELAELDYALFTEPAPEASEPDTPPEAPPGTETTGGGGAADAGEAPERHRFAWPADDPRLLRYLQFVFEQTREQESLVVIFYGPRGHAIEIAEASRGDRFQTAACHREITRRALELGRCHFLVLAHNHCGAAPLPSTLDAESTLRLREALRLVAVELVDHLIVSGDRYTSLSALGVLGPPADLPGAPPAIITGRPRS